MGTVVIAIDSRSQRSCGCCSRSQAPTAGNENDAGDQQAQKCAQDAIDDGKDDDQAWYCDAGAPPRTARAWSGLIKEVHER